MPKCNFPVGRMPDRMTVEEGVMGEGGPTWAGAY